MKKSSLALGLVLVLAFVSCDKLKSAAEKAQGAKTPVAVQTSTTASPEVVAATAAPAVATINGQPVTDAELTVHVASRLKKVESQIFDIKRAGLDDLIEEKLLKAESEKLKVSVDELIKKEVDDKLTKTTETEIQTFYSMYKAQMNNQPLDQVKDTIIKRLDSTKRNVQYNELMARLQKDNNVEVLMERPRITVSVDDDPSQGDKGAPITLIEFSDYQCPFCKRARSVVNQILETYKGKVFYVFRDYPLSFHKNAPKAAEAAECADEQDKYWPFANGLWEGQAELGPDKYKEIAKKIGLNEEKFKKCIDSGKFAAEVQKDTDDGEEVGVTGTPAYFINGIFISGAQPFEKFQQLIDEELKKAGK